MPLSNNGKYLFLFVSAPFGGIEVFFKNLESMVAKRPDIEATWIWIEMHPPELVTSIPPFSMNWTLKGGYVARNRILNLEKSGKRYDVALFNHIIPPAFLHDFRRRVPTLLSIDSTPKTLNEFGRQYFNRQKRRSKSIEGLTLKFWQSVYIDCARILPWSTIAQESLQRDYGVPSDKITIIPPGIDLEKWNLTRERGRDLEGRKTRILFVGNDFERKGGDLLLQIAKEPEFRDCHFDFVTSKFQGIASANVSIHYKVRSNSKDLLNLYSESDIFVLPTRADIAPTIVICEAMAMRLPIITTNVGGLDSVVEDSVSGFIVPAGNREILSRRLHQLVSSPDLRIRMGRRARMIAEEKFDLRRCAERIIESMIDAANRKASDAAET